MHPTPPQTPGIVRDVLGRETEHPDRDRPGGAASSAGGVLASQTRCDDLRGPARSMCYASLYGVKV